MAFDAVSFTPVRSLSGGLLIGAASALLYAGSGRIAGVSGISAGLLPMSRPDGRGWRVAFVLGLLSSAALVALLAPGALSLPTASWPTVLVAGLLVGVGTRLSNGCTSGHGVCGLSRGSPRSLASVLTFMLCAAITVVVTRSHGGAP